MLDIEGIRKRADDAKHYATCPKARSECKRCDDWFYASANFQSIVRSFVVDIEALLSDVHGSKAHRAEIRKALGLPDSIGVVAGASLVVEARDNAKRELANTRGELDELRTRHARIVDSMESFVAALVDERFKKDHAAMITELHDLRTKDIEASKRMRIETNAMPETARSVFESARIEAKSKGATILRTLVDMVVNARDSGRAKLAELNTLRDECRQHLARINVLESRIASLPDAPIPMHLYCPMCHVQHVDAGEFGMGFLKHPDLP